MNNLEISYLIVIACSLTLIVIGAVFYIIITARKIKDLEKEVDKFRDLYFEEMDKWKNKYNQDDYEAY
jgi:hypothetical protein